MWNVKLLNLWEAAFWIEIWMIWFVTRPWRGCTEVAEVWCWCQFSYPRGVECIRFVLWSYWIHVTLSSLICIFVLDLALKNGHTKIAELLKAEEKKTETANYTKCVGNEKKTNYYFRLNFSFRSFSPVQNNTILLALHVAAKNGKFWNLSFLSVKFELINFRFF